MEWLESELKERLVAIDRKLDAVTTLVASCRDDHPARLSHRRNSRASVGRQGEDQPTGTDSIWAGPVEASANWEVWSPGGRRTSLGAIARNIMPQFGADKSLPLATASSVLVQGSRGSSSASQLGSSFWKRNESGCPDERRLSFDDIVPLEKHWMLDERANEVWSSAEKVGNHWNRISRDSPGRDGNGFQTISRHTSTRSTKQLTFAADCDQSAAFYPQESSFGPMGSGEYRTYLHQASVIGSSDRSPGLSDATKDPFADHDNNPDDLNKKLLYAVQSGTTKDVQGLLLRGADPNSTFDDFSLPWKAFTMGSPVAIAVMRENLEMTKCLLDARADPDSKYGFLAGVEEQECVFPASHATIRNEAMALLQMLVDYKADLSKQASNDANLVWQAGYMGKTRMTKYLLSTGKCPIDIPVVSQDDHNNLYTPMHAAARAGKYDVVALLLHARAQVCGQNRKGLFTPLEDAIVAGHGSVVRELIVAGAELCSASSSVLTLLFSHANTVVISQAARGLCHAPSHQLDWLTPDDLVRFLREGGTAPLHILKAIIRQHDVRYWKNGWTRTSVRTAVVEKHMGFNVCEGKHVSYFERQFNAKLPPTPADAEFLGTLSPTRSSRGRRHGDQFVDVDLYMCHVPHIIDSMPVLKALADSEQDEIFQEIECQALVHLWWERISLKAYLLIAFQVVYLLLFCSLNLVLTNAVYGNSALRIVTICCGIVLTLEQLFETAQFAGYAASGLAQRYLFSWVNWGDQIRITCSAVIILIILIEGRDVKDSAIFGCVFGSVVFSRWMTVLYALRAVRGIGTRILPIMSTMWEVGPFTGVLFMYLCGFVNMYYALGLQDLVDSFILIFKIVIMGEVDLDEFEAASSSVYVRLNTTSLTATGAIIDAGRTPFYYIVRAMLVLTSFVMGVSLMNVFIAVLCISYEKAAKHSWREFIRTRADIALDHQTMVIGMRWMRCKRRRDGMYSTFSLTQHVSTNKMRQERLKSSIELEKATGGAEEDSTGVYVWLCCPSQQAGE